MVCLIVRMVSDLCLVDGMGFLIVNLYHVYLFDLAWVAIVDLAVASEHASAYVRIDAEMEVEQVENMVG